MKQNRGLKLLIILLLFPLIISCSQIENNPISLVSNSSSSVNVANLDNQKSLFNNAAYEEVYVSRVIDGDTIELDDGRKIRYLGIDTPETVHPRKSVECFGPEASSINKQLVLNKKIRIYKGKKNKDIYDRYLRYIVIHENEELLINDYLVKNGYATVNRKYQSDNLNKIFETLLSSEKLAIDTKKGLWNACR